MCAPTAGTGAPETAVRGPPEPRGQVAAAQRGCSSTWPATLAPAAHLIPADVVGGGRPAAAGLSGGRGEALRKQRLRTPPLLFLPLLLELLERLDQERHPESNVMLWGGGQATSICPAPPHHRPSVGQEDGCLIAFFGSWTCSGCTVVNASSKMGLPTMDPGRCAFRCQDTRQCGGARAATAACCAATALAMLSVRWGATGMPFPAACTYKTHTGDSREYAMHVVQPEVALLPPLPH